MVVSIVQTRFVFAEKMLRLKTKTIWKSASRKKALTWVSVSLIARMTVLVKIRVLIYSKSSMKFARVR